MKSHLYKCEETGDGVMFLQIYNLIKLKKDLIEEFMHKMGLFQSPPSDILNTIEPG